jgi:hypothetical protein
MKKITTKEELSKKINSYNSNYVKFIFTFFNKSTYYLHNSDFPSKQNDKTEKPIIAKYNDIIKCVIFPKSTFDEIVDLTESVDDYLLNIEKNNDVFLFLRDNYTNFDKKEERLLKLVDVLTSNNE